MKIRVYWKDVLHQPVNNILIFRKKVILHLPKNTYHIFPCGLQTVSE